MDHKQNQAKTTVLKVEKTNAHSEDPVSTVKQLETAPKKHGGARPGAGRKPGKWPLAKGRTKENSVNCHLHKESKEEFARQAREKGMNLTEYLEWMIEQNRTRTKKE